jgi:hypothetical protein
MASRRIKSATGSADSEIYRSTAEQDVQQKKARLRSLALLFLLVPKVGLEPTRF